MRHRDEREARLPCRRRQTPGRRCLDTGEPDRQHLYRTLSMARSRQGRDRANHHRQRTRDRRDALAPRPRRSVLLGYSRMSEPIIQSMTSQLISRFRDRILSGTYAPGSALRQDTLASEFGTSKIPVREALVQLQSEGLVDIFPNRGFQVRPLTTSELDEVFSLRMRIEPAAVAQGAKLASAADQLAARQSLERLNDALTAGEFSSSGQLNRAFHLALVVPRLQPVAAEILSRLHT